MAEPADINVDELRRRARRRLVGAVVLALAVAVIVPMLLETDQKPLGEDVSVKIPPIDEGKFTNRLNQGVAKDATPSADMAKAPATTAPAAAPERTSKYDTHIPDAPSAPASAAAVPAPAPAARAPTPTGAGSTADAKPPAPAPAETRAPEPPPARAPSPAEGAKPASAAKAAPAAAAHDGFAVQLAAFADDKGANALAGRLKRAGYTAYTEPLKTSKGTLWRVRVGPYASRDAAIAARDKLKSQGQSGIVAAVK